MNTEFLFTVESKTTNADESLRRVIKAVYSTEIRAMYLVAETVAPNTGLFAHGAVIEHLNFSEIIEKFDLTPSEYGMLERSYNRTAPHPLDRHLVTRQQELALYSFQCAGAPVTATLEEFKTFHDNWVDINGLGSDFDLIKAQG